jgi:hypothetical protein
MIASTSSVQVFEFELIEHQLTTDHKQPTVCQKLKLVTAKPIRMAIRIRKEKIYELRTQQGTKGYSKGRS